MSLPALAGDENERCFVLGHSLVALRTTGNEFPKPANHEIPVVVLVGLHNGGLLEFMNRQPTVRRVVPRYHWHVQPFLSEFFLAPLLCMFLCAFTSYSLTLIMGWLLEASLSIGWPHENTTCVHHRRDSP